MHLGCLGAVVTASGLGKTMVKNHCLETIPGACGGAANPTNNSIAGMQASLCGVVGAYPDRGAVRNYENICATIRRRNIRLIMLDESQHYPDICLDLARSIHDDTRVSIVFLGNYSMREKVNRNGQSAFSQLTSRIGVRHEQKAATPADVKAFAHHHGVGDPKAVSWLAKRCAGVGGGLRMASYLLAVARGTVEAGNIQLSHLQDAALVMGAGK